MKACYVNVWIRKNTTFTCARKLCNLASVSELYLSPRTVQKNCNIPTVFVKHPHSSVLSLWSASTYCSSCQLFYTKQTYHLPRYTAYMHMTVYESMAAKDIESQLKYHQGYKQSKANMSTLFFSALPEVFLLLVRKLFLSQQVRPFVWPLVFDTLMNSTTWQHNQQRVQ